MAKLIPELELYGPVNCPECGTTPVTLLDEATRRSELWWLACPACGRMWQVTRTDLLDASAPGAFVPDDVGRSKPTVRSGDED
jgi:formate dehydrogenase maturation protein FdhE